MDIPKNVVNKKLYKSVKDEIVKKMPKSSAYRSGLIVQEYKRRGGTYSGVKPKDTGLKSWFDIEKWINMEQYVKNNKKIPCSKEGIDTSACRPLNKGKRGILTADKVIEKHGKKKVIELVNKKKNNMNLKINWSRGTIS